MNELTDLEICKRIAEIEGIDTFESYDKVFDKCKLVSIYNGGVKWDSVPFLEREFFTSVCNNPSSYSKAYYNPLTNKALCFDLMLLHEIHLVGDKQKGYWAEPWIEKESPKVGAFDKNPQRAICLAIIAKHK